MRLARDLVGATFSDRYRLIARIAGGGMGEVYRGHDMLLDRSVAVKILQPSLASNPEFVQRFKQEARAAARLLHSNVVAVYDYGSEDERTNYIVMEYVAGTDLRDLLVGRGALEPSQAAEIMSAVCDALSAAHEVELVHRDVKPENVLISRNGTVKVADFGIAVVADAERTAPGGGVPGTLRYLSPEQAAGLHATAASDIWAAGALLSECLTGIPPSQGSGPELMERRAREDPIAPSEFDPGVSPDLDRIVMRACALDPLDRYPSAIEMAEDIRLAAARSLPDAPPVTELLHELTNDIRLPDSSPTTFTGGRRAPKHRKSRIKGFLRLVLALILVGLIGFGGVVGARALLAPAIIDVPTVVQANKDEAAERLRRLGLRVDFEYRRDKFETKGEVLDQAPLSGRLEEGSIVTLTISTGPPRVKLPQLVGLTVDRAEEILSRDKYGMSIGTKTRDFSLEEVGTIISVKPERRRVAWGSTIDVTVSKGPRQIEVPDVVGKQEAKAVAKIEDAGFKAVVVQAHSDDVEEGRVISTEPAGAEPVPEASEVKVYVSIGPEFEKLRLPDVRGKSLDEARSRLESLGLRVRVVQSCDGGSVVNETDPISGAVVRENDLIALFVC
ncbi:MAG TPA: PASTA domain-containing protein [Actinomycetota bacterium]|nr:PASTA domain-containing protein [Actinomycetota bacterium]